MATKKKLLQAAAGTAAAGGGAGGLSVENVFSTYLYEGNGASKVISNNIQLGGASQNGTVLHFNGDDLLDKSIYKQSFKTNTGVAVSTTTKKYGSGSLDMPTYQATVDYNDNFNLGTGDFTVECWVYRLDSSGGYQTMLGFDDSGNGLLFEIYLNQLDFGIRGWANNVSGTTVPSNQWVHLALSRESGVVRYFQDGTLIKTLNDANSARSLDNQSDAILGGYTSGAGYFNGYIDDLRLIKGTALYTSSFTAPTSALPIDTQDSTGEGGLVWTKSRTTTSSPSLYDTARGVSKELLSSSTSATGIDNGVISFNSNGYTVGNRHTTNAASADYASWTFRKAPKFFDVVTYTGTGSSLTIDHDLGVEPAVIIIKRTNTTGNWIVFTDVADGSMDYLYLNTTDASADGSALLSKSSTSFTLLQSFLYGNASGSEYVAYLFAHNDGDGEFGPDGDADIIKCGSYTGTGAAGKFVDLGFEPQWVLTKRTDLDGYNWVLQDNMRSMTDTDYAWLYADLANAEGAGAITGGFAHAQPTGYIINGLNDNVNGSGGTYIYIAIRRGPMAVPESATDVFAMDFATSSGAWTALSGFPIDFLLYSDTTSGSSNYTFSRLTSPNYMLTNATSAETGYTVNFDRMDGIEFPTTTGDYSTWINWMWKRAPNFFDVVAYTGTGSARTVSHNLGVAPEMIWVKRRSSAEDWLVYHSSTGNEAGTGLNETAATYTGVSAYWNSTTPTDTVFTVGTHGRVNTNTETYIAYLFASLDGVSKVGSYTGTGAAQNIDCGFSSGARFVLIKNATTGSTNWNLFDTERGIVAGNDPYLFLNTTDPEDVYGGADLVDPYSSGFTVANTGTAYNATGNTYIFYAIA